MLLSVPHGDGQSVAGIPALCRPVRHRLKEFVSFMRPKPAETFPLPSVRSLVSTGPTRTMGVQRATAMLTPDTKDCTPPTNRWCLTSGARVWVGGHNTDARREVERRLRGTARLPSGPIEAAFIAPRSCDEAVYFAEKLRFRLGSDGVIWLVYPGSTSARQSGFDGRTDDLIRALTGAGLVGGDTVPLAAGYLSTCFRPGTSPSREIKDGGLTQRDGPVSPPAGRA